MATFKKINALDHMFTQQLYIYCDNHFVRPPLLHQKCDLSKGVESIQYVWI